MEHLPTIAFNGAGKCFYPNNVDLANILNMMGFDVFFLKDIQYFSHLEIVTYRKLSELLLGKDIPAVGAQTGRTEQSFFCLCSC